MCQTWFLLPLETVIADFFPLSIIKEFKSKGFLNTLKNLKVVFICVITALCIFLLFQTEV